jgi:hypothetical protein
MIFTHYLYCILYPYCDRIVTLHRKETLRRCLGFVVSLTIVALLCSVNFVAMMLSMMTMMCRRASAMRVLT